MLPNVVEVYATFFVVPKRAHNISERQTMPPKVSGGVMWNGLVRMLLLVMLFPVALAAQERSRGLDVGGIQLTLGEQQQVVLTKLRTLYTVTFSADVERFSVNCSNSTSSALAYIKFTGEKLSEIFSYEDVDCSSVGGSSRGSPAVAINAVVRALRKLKSATGGNCFVNEADPFKKEVIFVNCGSGYSLLLSSDSEGFYSVRTSLRLR